MSGTLSSQKKISFLVSELYLSGSLRYRWTLNKHILLCICFCLVLKDDDMISLNLFDPVWLLLLFITSFSVFRCIRIVSEPNVVAVDDRSPL